MNTIESKYRANAEFSELLTVDEVKALLGLKTVQTVYRWIKNGVLPSCKIGRIVRVPKISVLELINKNLVQHEKGIFKKGNSIQRPSAPKSEGKFEWEK